MKNWIYGLLAKFSHVLLSGVLGTVAIVEAIRLGNYDQSDSFIIGPGGYMMAVGVGLVCFSCIGGIGGLIARSRSRPSRSAPSAPKGPNSSPTIQTQSERRELTQRGLSRMAKPIVSFLLCLGYILLIKPMGGRSLAAGKSFSPDRFHLHRDVPNFGVRSAFDRTFDA